MSIRKKPKKDFAVQAIIIIALLFLLTIIWLVFIEKNNRFDLAFLQQMDVYRTSRNTHWMKAISFLGNHQFLLPANLLLVIFFIWQKNRNDVLRVLMIALSSLAWMSLLKNLFHRSRPDYPLVEDVTNFSFPSGHALMSVAFWGLLLYFIWQKNKNRNFKVWMSVIILLVILAIGFSRVYLQLHYPTDVLAGWIIGSLWLYFMLQFSKRCNHKKIIPYT